MDVVLPTAPLASTVISVQRTVVRAATERVTEILGPAPPVVNGAFMATPV